MRAELTAIIRRSEGGGVVASCAEVPGTEIEADTEQEAVESLVEALGVVFEVNRNETLREAGPEFKRCQIVVDLDDLDENRLLQVDEEEIAVSP